MVGSLLKMYTLVIPRGINQVQHNTRSEGRGRISNSEQKFWGEADLVADEAENGASGTIYEDQWISFLRESP